MNCVIISGRLYKDVELKQAGSTTVANFGIAVDRKIKSEDVNADFFYCSAFGKCAEFIEKYFKKGSKIMLRGRIQNDTYTNKDGNRVTNTKIIAEEADFMESKSQNTAEASQNAQEGLSDGFKVSDLDEELPFA